MPKIEVSRPSQAAGLSTCFRWSDAAEPYLCRLREMSGLASAVDFSSEPVDAVLRVMEWVHSRIGHNGRSEPAKRDPISILEEAAAGKSFRCVEFAVVSAGVLTSLGHRSRVVALKTADVETREEYAGHVVVETFDRRRSRWLFADSQWGVVPVCEGRPVNGIELKAALETGAELSLLKTPSAETGGFCAWIRPYLFYFDAAFDQRYGESLPGSAERLMFVPEKAAEPKIFQRCHPLTGITYTHDPEVFWRPPETGAADEGCGTIG